MSRHRVIPILLSKGFDFMSKNKDQPFLVYYPMVLTHTPFVSTPHEPNVESKIDKYKAMGRYTDFIVEKI